MAVKPDYTAGTVSLANGGTAVTGVGTAWVAAQIQPGDLLLKNNRSAVISAVNSNTSITLEEAWDGGELTGANYRIRYQSGDSRIAGRTQSLVDLLDGGNAQALAALVGAAQKIPMFTGAGTMELFDASGIGNVKGPDESATGEVVAFGVDPKTVVPTGVAAADLLVKVDLQRRRVEPRFIPLGGQLRHLKQALIDPFYQFLGIEVSGDSIPWGRSLAANGTSAPKNMLLTDPRDVFASPSFINIFKRYVGATYAKGVDPVLSNWPGSPSGQAIATYSAPATDLYPGFGRFTVTTTGTATAANNQSVSSRTGFQLRFDIAAGAGNHGEVTFEHFTGKSFDIVYAAVSAETNADYDLYVDDELIGTYSTSVGVDGAVSGSGNVRTHTFDFVRDATVRIVAKEKAGSGALSRFRFESLTIHKVIRITNNAIIGITSDKYLTYALSGEFDGGVAVKDDDTFILLQIGPNDRIIRADVPKGKVGVDMNMTALVQDLKTRGEVILMCANPTTDFDPAVHSLEMADIRAVQLQIAQSEQVDFIDHYAYLLGLDPSGGLADGLHPNELWHQLISDNIIGSLEAAFVPTNDAEPVPQIEEGSNANGSYMKHPGGTLRCWRQFDAATIAGNSSAVASWTFPEAFISAPIVIAGVQGASGADARLANVGAATPSATGVNITALATTATTVTVTMVAEAIGRWKE